MGKQRHRGATILVMRDVGVSVVPGRERAGLCVLVWMHPKKRLLYILWEQASPTLRSWFLRFWNVDVSSPLPKFSITCWIKLKCSSVHSVEFINWARQEAHCLRWVLQFIHDNTALQPGFGSYLPESRGLQQSLKTISSSTSCLRMWETRKKGHNYC